MKVWVFDVIRDTTLEDSKRYFVEEIDNEIIKVYITPVKVKYTSWAWIDELKMYGFIRYRTNFRTYRGTNMDSFYEACLGIEND